MTREARLVSNLTRRPLSDPQDWKTLESHTAFQNRWLSVLIDSVVLPGGATYEYTRLAPAGIGVGVIGFNEQGEVLMERVISSRRGRSDLAIAWWSGR